MNKWFELIDNQTGKRYRISYAKNVSTEKRERWRKEWKEGRISFVCGCGCPFGINARGAMYYPAELKNKNGNRRHGKECIKYREEVEREKMLMVLSVIPKRPKEAGIYRRDWVEICKEWDMTEPERFLKQLICIEDGVERKLTHYVQNVKEVNENCRFLVSGVVKEIKCYPYGFRKLTLCTSSGKRHTVWLSDTFFDSYRSELNVEDRFIGFCYVRHEKWKGELYRKIYVLEGLIA